MGWDSLSGPWSMDDDSMDKALHGFLKEHQVAGDRVFTVLPRHDVTCRILNLPSHDNEELTNMVRLSAEEFVPYAADELIIDQSVLRPVESGESQVLAVLVHRDMVKAQLSILRKSGIVPEQILLSSACLASACAAAQGLPKERYAIVNLSPAGLEIAVMHQGTLQYTRGIANALDWQLAGESGDVQEELAIELRSSLATYRRESEDGIGVDTVYLASDIFDTSTTCEALTSELGKDCFPVTFADALMRKGSEHCPHVPLVALGAALTAQDRGQCDIRLLPESILQDRAMAGTQKTALRLALLAACILTVLGAWFYYKVNQYETYLGELDQQISVIQPAAQGVAAKLEKLAILGDQVNKEGSVIELLATACRAAPSRSKLNIARFEYDRKTGLNIWGRAKSVQDVFNFDQTMHKLGKGHLALFAQAHSQYEKQTRERNKTVYNYWITIPIPKEEDSENNPATNR
jgi:hypothetical protein